MSTKTPAIEICINNYINGNLTDAKKQAKRFDRLNLTRYLMDNYDYSMRKANKTAMYLKELATFQEACDAE